MPGRVGRPLGAAAARVRRQSLRGRSPFRNLRRLEPVSRTFGFDRGLPVDRWYIERFLEDHSMDIRGNVLEIGDDTYTRRFGRPDNVDVLNVDPTVSGTTLVADLTQPAGLPSGHYDCVICTQTLQFIYDVCAAVQGVHRLLKPGGVALCTAAGISQVSRYDMDRWGDYWRFTTLSLRALFDQVFGEGQVEVQSVGNVLAAVAFLEGMAAEELRPEELAHRDDDYQLLLTVRATRAAGAA